MGADPSGFPATAPRSVRKTVSTGPLLAEQARHGPKQIQEPVITGISDRLNINQYTYDYGKVCALKDRIASNITPDMTVLQIYRVIRDEIAAWRNDPKTEDALIVDFRAWCELHRSLSKTLEKSFRMEIADQVLAVRNRINTEEARRHAS